MNSYRKKYISDLLKTVGEVIQENPEITVAQIMTTVFRPKNINSENKDTYHMTDEDFSSALESTLSGIKEMLKNE